MLASALFVALSQHPPPRVSPGQRQCRRGDLNPHALAGTSPSSRFSSCGLDGHNEDGQLSRVTDRSLMRSSWVYFGWVGEVPLTNPLTRMITLPTLTVAVTGRLHRLCDSEHLAHRLVATDLHDPAEVLIGEGACNLLPSSGPCGHLWRDDLPESVLLLVLLCISQHRQEARPRCRPASSAPFAPAARAGSRFQTSWLPLGPCGSRRLRRSLDPPRLPGPLLDGVTGPNPNPTADRYFWLRESLFRTSELVDTLTREPEHLSDL